jgi:hypothetical protein
LPARQLDFLFLIFPVIGFINDNDVRFFSKRADLEICESWILDANLYKMMTLVDVRNRRYVITDIRKMSYAGLLWRRPFDLVFQVFQYVISIDLAYVDNVEFSKIIERTGQAIAANYEHWYHDELGAGEGGAEPQDWPTQLAYFTVRIRAATSMHDLMLIFDDPYAGILTKRSVTRFTES